VWKGGSDEIVNIIRRKCSTGEAGRFRAELGRRSREAMEELGGKML